MTIDPATAIAFVTGTNKPRGIGRALVNALLAAGAPKVYAAARKVDALRDLVDQHGDRVVPVALDITDYGQITAAAALATDITLLVNNAGMGIVKPAMAVTRDEARQEMAVNYFGLLDMAQVFAPVLAQNGGGAMVNISSIAGVSNFPMLGNYSATKAANHSLTQGLRFELEGQGTHVMGVYPGPIDTDMADDVPFDKVSPAHVAQAVLKGLVDGET